MTNISIECTDGKWSVMHGDSRMSIAGVSLFDSRESLVETLSSRGLYVSSTGEVSRTPFEEDEETLEEVETSEEIPEEGHKQDSEALYPQKVKTPLTPEQKEKYALSTKRWRERHPERVAEYRDSWREDRRKRYQTDPAYREKVRAANRKAYQKRVAAQKAAKEAQ